MSTSAPSVPTFGLWYDLRNPARWRQPIGTLYRDTLDQAVWAERDDVPVPDALCAAG